LFQTFRFTDYKVLGLLLLFLSQMLASILMYSHVLYGNGKR